MGMDDDFLVPRDVDLSLGCDIDRTVEHGGTVLRAFAVMSIASYLYLFWMYFVVKTPVLKRHPTRLAIYGCLIEMGYFQQYLWIPTISKSYLYSDDAASEPYYCSSSDAAGRWALVTQFCIIGVQMCFLVISVDLRLAYTNPFSSFKHNKFYFAAAVICFSLFTSFCLLVMGPRVYGYDEHGVIWIQDSRASLAMNWPKFMLYYLIITCIFVYSIWANFQFYRSSEKGLSVTISNRLSIMNRSKRFVIGHITCYSVILALEFLSFVNKSDYQVLLSLPSYLQALRGVLGTMVILYSNWEDLTWASMNPFYFVSSNKDTNMVERVALEGLMQQPHLNTALRAEILYFTTQGIMFAAHSFGTDNGFDMHDHTSGTDESGNHHPDKQVENANTYGFEAQSTSGGANAAELGAGRSMPTGTVKLQRNITLTGAGPVLGGNTAKPAAKSASGGSGGDGAGGRDTFSELSRFHKAQDEALHAAREEAFRNELASFGLDRDSVSFQGVDDRHNSSSASVSPYASIALSGRTSVFNGRGSLSHPGGSTTNSNRGSSLYTGGANNQSITSINTANNGTRNPLSSSAQAALEEGMHVHNAHNNVRNSGQGQGHAFKIGSHNWARESEVEMKTKDNKRVESTDSHSSDVTVKWKDTTDVEFSMGRVDSQNNSAPDAWYRVPSSPKGNRPVVDPLRHASRTTSSSDTVDMVKRTLQSALNKTQSMFNPAYREFRFKDFSPGLFAKVREMCNITPDEYARSFEATCKETFSEGRSGAFMFFSSDQRCIAKSTPKHELLSLQKLMPAYVNYLMHNPTSLITRFLGAHCITMYGVELHFVVMLNCFPSHRLSERYDLKGSWVNRHALTKVTSRVSNKQTRQMVNSPMLYLDNDLQHKLSLQPGVAPLIVEQIIKDSEFLTAHHKMDYSLLIGVKKERFEVLLPGSGLDQNQTSGQSLSAASPVSPAFRNTVRDSGAVMLSAPYGRITDHARGRSMSSRSLSAYDKDKLSNSIVSPSASLSSPVPPVTPGAMRVISRADDEDAQDPDEDGGLHSHFVEGPAKYYIGIIDVLQEWTLQKRLERAIKVYFFRNDAEGISAMQPVAYQKRFLRRCVLDVFEGIEEPTMSFVSGQTADVLRQYYSYGSSKG